VTPLIGFAALSALIAWLVRRPSSELFEAANDYYGEAEHWQARAADKREPPGLVSAAIERRALCLSEAAALARKALRRMPWKLL
jgi:hypothetical protein